MFLNSYLGLTNIKKMIKDNHLDLLNLKLVKIIGFSEIRFGFES